MFFKRKIYQTLLDWKTHSNGKTALLIEGARRIGKSTIAEHFAQEEYKSYLLIDFNNADAAVKDAFENHLTNLDDFYMILSAVYGKTLYPRDSLIIFDEVQQFPKARQTIKYLVADGRYDFIETGSLISIRENVKNISIPSEEQKIKMYPMDFEEFADALGEQSLIAYIKLCFEKKKPLPETMHHKAMLLFKQYMLIGGMPMPVARFLESGKMFDAADLEKRLILDLYREDIRKIDRKYQARVQMVFDQIPAFLSKHEKRVNLSSLGSESRFDDYEDSFFWLSDSMIANECFNCQDPNVGLAINEDRTFVKCYMGDTGLLVSHAFNEKEIAEGALYKQILYDNLSINEGMLFENAIAQCLVASGYQLFFYTRYNKEKHRNDIEIDFLISNGSKTKPKVFPIEVKSGKRYTIKSLERFLDVFHDRIGDAYVIHTKNLLRKDRILYLPAYMAFCL